MLTRPGVIAAAIVIPAPVSIAPDTVRVAETFAVTVNSFGTACTEPYNTSTLLGGNGPNVVQISVFDRLQLQANCATPVRAIPRQVQLSFANTGTASIRVRGRYEPPTGSAVDSFVVVEKQLVVRD